MENFRESEFSKILSADNKVSNPKRHFILHSYFRPIEAGGNKNFWLPCSSDNFALYSEMHIAPDLEYCSIKIIINNTEYYAIDFVKLSILHGLAIYRAQQILVSK